MKLRIRETSLFLNDLTTRLPFRYGITTLTRAPHLFVRVVLEIDARTEHGVAADNLPPKWFTKNPSTSYREDLAGMLAVIRHACSAAQEAGAHASVFELWRAITAAQKVWAAAQGHPPLLAGFGVSLVERALIDAFCRATGTTFARAVRENALGIRLGEICREIVGEPADFLPRAPLSEVIVRHTVGLTDSLTDAEIPDAERVRDGLPQSLEACIRAEGLTHFKIKLSGDIAQDRARLHRLAELLDRSACAFTLDGNENYHAVAPLRALWEQFRADPIIAHFLRGLLFLEQPLHRDVALSEATAAELLAWPDRPQIIIDESDAEPGDLARALRSGYAGTSHKNCKGVIKGIANAALIATRRRAEPARPLHLSAEDLTNVGPVALLQDLAVVATLGIAHAERNGHHYFAGLSQFPASVQRAVLAAHGDLYRAHDGYPVVRVEQGKVSTRSVIAAPFGSAITIDPAEFTPEPEWDAARYGAAEG